MDCRNSFEDGERSMTMQTNGRLPDELVCSGYRRPGGTFLGSGIHREGGLVASAGEDEGR
jgi:hypothetical protein